MFRKIFFSAAAFVALVVIQGCATPASPAAMAVSSDEVPFYKNEKIKSAIQVRNVSGGKETNPALASQVDSGSFKQALQQSLQRSGYAASPQADAKYTLDAEIQAVSQPMFGLTFDVTSTIRYTVEGQGERKIIPITAVGTATTSDAFYGVERLKIANERSIKENIKQFLKEFSSSF